MTNGQAQVLSDSHVKEEQFIKVKADRIGRLMDMVGELGLISDEVVHHPSLAELELEEYDSAAHRLTQLVRELQDEASGLRLVSISGTFKRLQRLVRDLSKKTEKPIDFIIQGEDTEIDKVVVDTLFEPLIHLIRNAIDHGIESEQERERKNKPSVSKIELQATQTAGDILITLSDDGRGLDKNKIVKKAIKNGLISSKVTLSDEEIYQLIFQPGFSTKDEVSELSGRGVGMDVVKTTISSLRGRISIKSEAGIGSTFSLLIPLSIAFLEAMIVRVKNRLFAFPIESVLEVLQADRNIIFSSSANSQTVLDLRDSTVPVRSLEQLFDEDEHTPLEKRLFLITQIGEEKIAVPIDEIYGQHQISVKPLIGALKSIRAANGCGLLPNGDVAILLDHSRLAE